MSGAELGLALPVFLACTVEAVEALTIVLAVGGTRSWSSALSGVGVACVVLAAIVAVLGTALQALPIDALRIIIGALLLLFGLQWLRKAVMRAAGLKALHDEESEYERETQAALQAAGVPDGFDRYSFAVSFQGVLLEGLEVALIVVTLGSEHGDMGLAVAAAAAAVLFVVAAGVAVRAPLAKVPENTLKFAVGVMLTTYGLFWAGEGLGVSWPGGDAMLLVIALAVLAASLITVRSLRQRTPRSAS
jgi:uncharacterized membrane protein